MNFKRLTGAILIIVLAHVMSSTSAFADDKTDVVAAVNRFLDNLGDNTLEKALSVCDSLSIDYRRISAARVAWPDGLRGLVEGVEHLQREERDYRWIRHAGNTMECRRHRRSRVLRGSDDLHLQAARKKR